MIELIILLIAFQVKHFVVDFLLQSKYQYLNKGIYWHPGGWLHAALHGAGTLAILLWCMMPIGMASIVMLAEIFIHHLVDWSKVNINKKLGWGPTTHEEFWWLLGFDQLLHQLTYVGIIGVVLFASY